MKDNNTILFAEVVLLAPSGKSILDKPATTKNLKALQPNKDALSIVRAYFTKEGFNVNGEGVSLTISGKKELFEKVFKFSIALKEVNKVNYASAISSPIIPVGIKPIVKTIVFGEPMEFFV